MNNLKKGAVIVAMVMMVSLVPVFALNDTANNTTDNQPITQTNQNQYGQENSNAGSGNCGNCDGTCDGNQHRYGQGNGNAGSGNCDGQNCQGANCANKT